MNADDDAGNLLARDFIAIEMMKAIVICSNDLKSAGSPIDFQVLLAGRCGAAYQIADALIAESKAETQPAK